MNVLHHQVGGEQDRAGRGAQHRGVVAYPDLAVARLPQLRPQPLDETELAQLR